MTGPQTGKYSTRPKVYWRHLRACALQESKALRAMTKAGILWPQCTTTNFGDYDMRRKQ